MTSNWSLKGATLSDKTACKEYGLKRQEVETLVQKKHGNKHLEDQKMKTERLRINRELRQLKNQTALEAQKSELIANLNFHTTN